MESCNVFLEVLLLGRADRWARCQGASWVRRKSFRKKRWSSWGTNEGAKLHIPAQSIATSHDLTSIKCSWGCGKSLYFLYFREIRGWRNINYNLAKYSFHSPESLSIPLMWINLMALKNCFDLNFKKVFEFSWHKSGVGMRCDTYDSYIHWNMDAPQDCLLVSWCHQKV